jgi:hypothetical protein
LKLELSQKTDAAGKILDQVMVSTAARLDKSTDRSLNSRLVAEHPLDSSGCPT